MARLRAQRPFSEKLQATGSLDRAGYQVGDTVQVTFTLTNTSGGDLHGLSAGCDHDDNANCSVDAGEAITGTVVELVDRVDGTVAATAVSDARGHVAFGTVPAGP